MVELALPNPVSTNKPKLSKLHVTHVLLFRSETHGARVLMLMLIQTAENYEKVRQVGKESASKLCLALLYRAARRTFFIQVSRLTKPIYAATDAGSTHCTLANGPTLLMNRETPK